MGFLGALGKAFTAPIKQTTKLVGKVGGATTGLVGKVGGATTGLVKNTTRAVGNIPGVPGGSAPAPITRPRPPMGNTGALGTLAKAGAAAGGALRDVKRDVVNPVGYSGKRMFDRTPGNRRVARSLSGRR